VKSAKSSKPSRSPALGAFLCLCAAALLSGCTVVAVTATAVSVTASAVGLAADAAVGTVKIVGKGVGKAVDAMSDDGAAEDNSGITVRYRTPDGQPLNP
jgi:hypothetical protein